MDNINNRIDNYFDWYKIEKNKENFEKIKKVIDLSQCHIYVEILDFIKSCEIIKNVNHGLIIEIDSEENKDLLDDLVNKFFIKRLGQRRVEEKIGHGYEVGNLFIKLLIHRFWNVIWKSWKIKIYGSSRNFLHSS